MGSLFCLFIRTSFESEKKKNIYIYIYIRLSMSDFKILKLISYTLDL